MLTPFLIEIKLLFGCILELCLNRVKINNFLRAVQNALLDERMPGINQELHSFIKITAVPATPNL
jgi:hypothetical protein